MKPRVRTKEDSDREKRWRENNREHVRSVHKAWKAKNRDKVLDAYYVKRFGITLEQVLKKVDAQRGRCAICDTLTHKLKLDHNHITGQVRDLLCNQCNTGLGLFKESPEILEGAIRYLSKHHLP